MKGMTLNNFQNKVQRKMYSTGLPYENGGLHFKKSIFVSCPMSVYCKIQENIIAVVNTISSMKVFFEF